MNQEYTYHCESEGSESDSEQSEDLGENEKEIVDPVVITSDFQFYHLNYSENSSRNSTHADSNDLNSNDASAYKKHHNRKKKTIPTHLLHAKLKQLERRFSENQYIESHLNSQNHERKHHEVRHVQHHGENVYSDSESIYNIQHLEVGPRFIISGSDSQDHQCKLTQPNHGVQSTSSNENHQFAHGNTNTSEQRFYQMIPGASSSFMSLGERNIREISDEDDSLTVSSSKSEHEEDVSPLIETKARELKFRLQNRKLKRLLNSVVNAQLNFSLRLKKPDNLFLDLLNEVLKLMNCSFGFIGEKVYIPKDFERDEKSLPVDHSAWWKNSSNDAKDNNNNNFHPKKPSLYTHAISLDSSIIAQKSIEEMLNLLKSSNFLFDNLDNLFGAVILSGETIITNHPKNHPSYSGKELPENHPVMDNFMGIPFVLNDGTVIGMLGLSNKKGGFKERDAEFLKPLITTCTILITSWRYYVEKEEARSELRNMNESLEKIVNERTSELQKSNDRLKQEIERRKRIEEKLIEEQKYTENILAEKQQFLRAMSHDSRTPLNCIIGCSDLLLQDIHCGENCKTNQEQIQSNPDQVIKTSTNLTENQIEYVEMIKSSGETILSLVNDFLDYSKTQALKQLNLKPFDIYQVLEEVLEYQSHETSKKNVDFILDIDPQFPHNITFISDPVKFKQVIMNILSNAVKFTDEGKIVMNISIEFPGSKQYDLQYKNIKNHIDSDSRVKSDDIGQDQGFSRINADTNSTVSELEISSSSTKNDSYESNYYSNHPTATIKITISDTGIGVDPKNLDKIGSPFYQTSKAQNHSRSGTGLGMSITKKICELMNGSLSIRSEGIGKGATVTINMEMKYQHIDRLPNQTSKSPFIEKNSSYRSIQKKQEQVLKCTDLHLSQIIDQKYVFLYLADQTFCRALWHYLLHLGFRQTQIYECFDRFDNLENKLQALLQQKGPGKLNSSFRVMLIVDPYLQFDAKTDFQNNFKKITLTLQRASEGKELYYKNQRIFIMSYESLFKDIFSFNQRNHHQNDETGSRTPFQPFNFSHMIRKLFSDDIPHKDCDENSTQKQQRQKNNQLTKKNEKVMDLNHLNVPSDFSVLVIDDNSINSKVLKHILTKFNIQHVSCCENGEEAIQILHKASFDLVFVDLWMPKMDGWQFLTTIQDEEHAHLNDHIGNIGILTAHILGEEDQLRLKSFEKVKEILIKPIRLQRVYEVLSNILQD